MDSLLLWWLLRLSWLLKEEDSDVIEIDLIDCFFFTTFEKHSSGLFLNKF